MATKNYTVEGMTCGHCEMSVKEEIGEIAGVTGVSADHTTARSALRVQILMMSRSPQLLRRQVTSWCSKHVHHTH